MYVSYTVLYCIAHTVIVLQIQITKLQLYHTSYDVPTMPTKF
jgi:hypothetical protein